MRQSILKLQAAQGLDRRGHRIGCIGHVFRHRFDRFVLTRKLTRTNALHESLRLLAQFFLGIAQKLGVFFLLGSRLLALLFLKSRADNFFLALNDIAALLALTTLSTAALLALRELAFIRLGFEKVHIGRALRLGVARLGMEHHVVARA